MSGRSITHQLPLLVTLAMTILLTGCRKEKDSWIPEVEIHSPAFGEEFDLGDKITVRASITDREIITFVRVYLADAGFNPVTSAGTFTPNVASYELETEIWVLGEYLEAGTYYVVVRAENGVNFKLKYEEVILFGGELEFRQLLIIGDGGFKTLKVSGSEDFTTITDHFTLTGDYAASTVSRKDQLLFLAGRNSINIQAWSLEDYTLAWQLDPTPGKPMHNRDCLFSDELLYATNNYEYIRGYTPAGQTGFSAFIDEMDAPENIIRHGDNILVDMQKKNGDNPYLVTYFAITGNEKQRREINFDIVSFHPMDNALVAVLGNMINNETGVCHLFAPSSNVLISTTFLPEQINASVLTDDGTIVMAGDNGIYALYKELGNIATIHDKGAQMVEFERLSGSLILGSHLKIEVFDFPEMVNQKTLLFSDTIFDMHIHYSK